MFQEFDKDNPEQLACHSLYKIAHDDSWRAIPVFEGADAARVRWFTADECKRLLSAVKRDRFGLLLRAELHTGCRVSERARLTVADFRSDNSASHPALYIGPGKTQKARWVYLSEKGGEFFRSLTAGRDPNERMCCVWAVVRGIPRTIATR